MQTPESRPMSPFTKFLTEMNSKINQQLGDEKQTLELEDSPSCQPPQPRKQCWLSAKEPERVADITVTNYVK